MTVSQMSGQEPTRLRVMIDPADNRITIEAAAALMGLGRRPDELSPAKIEDAPRNTRPLLLHQPIKFFRD
jgi:hypothetical protein